MNQAPLAPLGWGSVFRLGLVQMALGAIVVLTTSALNRVMVVELALPAMIPGALVTLHHGMQLLRPRMGYGSDVGQRRTPWIVGGMVALAMGGVLAAFATTVMMTQRAAGLALGTLAFALIGGGVSAAGTSLLVIMAKRVAPTRRAASATIVWMMMIMGFAITAGTTGKLLDPYSPERLLTVSAGVCAAALVLAVVAIWGVEGKATSSSHRADEQDESEPKPAFFVALREVWAEPGARRFTVFVAASMLSYSAQDLVLEPFAGTVFGYTLGQSTSLSGTQHQGIFVGMLFVAVVTAVFRNTVLGSLRGWVVGGCAASSVALLGLAVGGLGVPSEWPLKLNVFLLGAANGVFSIAAIGSMMALASEGRSRREGVRMGVWGSAQAIAFGAGGFIGTVVADAARVLLDNAAAGYAVVFVLEAIGFGFALAVARTVSFPRMARAATPTLMELNDAGAQRSAA